MPLGSRVVQWDDTSCGPAAVATLLNVYERPWSRVSLEREAAVSETGVSMLGLIRAFQSHGLEARGLKAGPDGLMRVPRPFIAYLQPEGGHASGHFVVVETLRESAFQVFDPTSGSERDWSRDELLTRSRGIVLAVSD